MDAEGVLGIRKSSRAELMRKGLPYHALQEFQDHAGLTQVQISKAFGIPRRTITHRKALGVLSPYESDRLYRGARVFAMAVELFEGDMDAAREWMISPEVALGGRPPLDLIGTDIGAQEVARLIERLEEGMPA